MISCIRGEVLEIGLDHAVIDAGGLGYRINTTPATLAGLRRGQPARLETTLIVREDSMTLYGFADPQARELFGVLQTVTGVGPRLAMATLAVLEPDQLRMALSTGDIKTLTRVPGIGKRVADRLVVELRDKVGVVAAPDSGEPGVAVGGPVRDQVVDALVGLGFLARAAEQTVDAVLTEQPAAGNAVVLRASLAQLGAAR